MFKLKVLDTRQSLRYTINAKCEWLFLSRWAQRLCYKCIV